MEKNVRPNSSKFILKIILQLFIISLLILVLMIVYKDYNNEKDSYLKTQKKHNIVENQSKITLQKLKDDSIKTIQNTKETREMVYSQTLELEKAIKNGTTNAKIAYLSFDDGPYYKTLDVLSILNKYQVKAIFFTTSINGDYCYDNKNYYCLDNYKEYVKYGMEIGNHTYTHSIRRGLYKSLESFIEAVDKQEEHIKTYADGYEAKIVRFPGGSGSAGKIKQEAKAALIEKGYGWIDWTALDGDGGTLKSTEEAWENFTKTIDSNIEVVLLHDYSKITIELLPKIIEYLQDNGYLILPLKYESIMVNK